MLQHVATPPNVICTALAGFTSTYQKNKCKQEGGPASNQAPVIQPFAPGSITSPQNFHIMFDKQLETPLCITHIPPHPRNSIDTHVWTWCKRCRFRGQFSFEHIQSTACAGTQKLLSLMVTMRMQPKSQKTAGSHRTPSD